MNNTDITVHIQVFKNKKAVEEFVKRFRKHFPKTKLVMHGDNGDNFEYLSKEYDFDYIHWNDGIPPIDFAGGKWKEYLKRLLITCEKYPNEWFLLMEEDVNTLHNNIEFPECDFSGVKGQPFSAEFNNYINKIHSHNHYVKYNSCGGSLIKMSALVESINSVLDDKINLYQINNLDNRILKYLDVLISAILHLNGFMYGEWEQLAETSSGVYKENPVFDHSWKEFYDYDEYNKFRKYN
jgi:hypothetical protein